MPGCTWTPVDGDSFELTFADGTNTVRARLVVDDVGRLVDFHTEDRWYTGTDPPTRARWTTPVDGWTTRPDGRPIPAHGSAVWHLPDGELTYVRGRFDPGTLRVDEPASSDPAGASATAAPTSTARTPATPASAPGTGVARGPGGR